MSGLGDECTITNTAGKRICCVCPETKAVRDRCVLLQTEEQCKDSIEAHKRCLRSEGFDVK